MTIIRLLTGLLLGTTVFHEVYAASTVERFTVNQIVSDATRYNGCLVRVSPSPSTIFADCGANYVTLGCDGAAGPSKSAAARNLSAAQLAFVTNQKVFMRLYDVAPEGESYCLVDRVDNTKTPN